MYNVHCTNVGEDHIVRDRDHLDAGHPWDLCGRWVTRSRKCWRTEWMLQKGNFNHDMHVPVVYLSTYWFL